MADLEHPVFNPEALKRLAQAGAEMREAARNTFLRLNDQLRAVRLAREEALRRRRMQAAVLRLFLETPEMREIVTASKFRLALYHERQTGLAYVRALGDQARADLGLRPEFDPINRKEQ